MKRGRLRYAAAMFAREELRPAIRHLKQGGVLWYAPDQDMRGKDTRVRAVLRRAGRDDHLHPPARAPERRAVVPFFHRRDGADYVLRIGAPLADFPSDDATVDTARVNAAIEAMVREAPAQYLWIHRRFKRRPEGMTPPYRAPRPVHPCCRPGASPSGAKLDSPRRSRRVRRAQVQPEKLRLLSPSL